MMPRTATGLLRSCALKFGVRRPTRAPTITVMRQTSDTGPPMPKMSMNTPKSSWACNFPETARPAVTMTKTTSAMFMADARYTMMGPSPSDFGRTPLLVTRATLERALSGRVSRKTARTTKVAAVANAGTPFRRDHDAVSLKHRRLPRPVCGERCSPASLQSKPPDVMKTSDPLSSGQP